MPSTAASCADGWRQTPTPSTCSIRRSLRSGRPRAPAAAPTTCPTAPGATRRAIGSLPTRKAAREAKTRTSWVDPDAAYESALEHFVSALLEPTNDAPFLVDVSRFVARIAKASAFTSLARIAIHLTAPGTPDLYQGD